MTLGRTYSKESHISNSGRQQSGFIRKLEENVSQTEVVITDVQRRVCFDNWIHGGAPYPPHTSPWGRQADAQQKLRYLNAPCAAARSPTMNSGICSEALRPQRLIFLYRGGTCLLSFLTESCVQTAIAINKGLNNGIWDCKSSSEQGLTTTLTQYSLLYSWLAFGHLCKIYFPRKI